MKHFYGLRDRGVKAYFIYELLDEPYFLERDPDTAEARNRLISCQEVPPAARFNGVDPAHPGGPSRVKSAILHVIRRAWRSSAPSRGEYRGPPWKGRRRPKPLHLEADTDTTSENSRKSQHVRLFATPGILHSDEPYFSSAVNDVD